MAALLQLLLRPWCCGAAAVAAAGYGQGLAAPFLACSIARWPKPKPLPSPSLPSQFALLSVGRTKRISGSGF